MEKAGNTKAVILVFTLIFIQFTIFALIIFSIVAEDWVRMDDWTGSLFYCESGEYKDQQYFSIHCSHPGCPGKRFGLAGVAYLICSVFSLSVLVTWFGFLIYQYKSETKPQKCTRIFFTVGSVGVYYFGILAWVIISGIMSPLSQFGEKCGAGVKIGLACGVFYCLAIVFYYLIYRDDDAILIARDEENKGKDMPDMKSVKIEGRFVYPNSFEYEEHEGDNSDKA